MSGYTLPFLFINLGGEMLYILDQRLRAQKIAGEKAKKVLNDIAGIMLNQQFVDELFKPQDVYSEAALRSLFHDLAHASVMRLNETSMSKLYDLMMMVFKQQVFCATQPKDLILITLNHLDSMRYLVSSPAIYKQLDATYFLTVKTYGQMRPGELQRIRYHLLNFFQDMRIRVSIFLRNQVQNNDGTFVIPVNNTIAHGNEVPGNIRIYGNDGCIEDLINFSPGGVYTVAAEAGSTELRGIRHTALGTNIYSTKSEIKGNAWDQAVMDSVTDHWESKESSANYREELNLLLIQLTGSKQTSGSSQEVICLNLFDTEENDSGEKSETRKYEIVNIKSTPEHSATLVKIMSEMSPHTSLHETSQPSLLELMDGLV